MMDNMGRTVGNAPSIVRDARALAILSFVILGIWLLVSLIGPMGAMIIRVPVIALIMAVDLYLIISLKRGTRAAYYVQLVLSILGLLGFPIGTLIHGYILFKWTKPETKAWFGV